MHKAYVVALVIVAILASMSVFTVDERQKAIVLRLGRIERSDYKPGLHFKIPLIDTVVKFDARIQNQDSEPQLYLTAEKKNVIVDSFVKWKIQDVDKFYKTVGGSTQRANDRLSVLILKRLKDAFGKRTIQQVVSGQRAQIMDKITVQARAQAAEFGIDILDVRIKRVDLPDKVSQSVYARMAAERKKVAKRFRSEGEEQAKQIRAEADREREVLLAEAERDAQKIKGEGDARATDIYAKAYGQDPEFYDFYRSLQAYRNTFTSPSDVLLLDPTSQFFKYFKDPRGGQH